MVKGQVQERAGKSGEVGKSGGQLDSAASYLDKGHKDNENIWL
jgi:hypothetical protein